MSAVPASRPPDHAPRLRVLAVDLFERDVVLRMPFRFGVVTLTAAPQAFARVRIRIVGGPNDGAQAEGAAAELLAPKWFDKNPALSNEDNFEQLRNAIRLARSAYLAHEPDTAFGHFARSYEPHRAAAAAQGLNGLVAGFGPALLDRAVLDALCRALGLSFADAVRRNLPGLHAGPLTSDLDGFDLPGFLAALRPPATIEARHTVGLVDPITAADPHDAVGDGLPETLDDVVRRYRHRWYKLKVAGDPKSDVERLSAIASVLDASGIDYRASLDGNEQYDDVDGVVELWRRIAETPRLARLAQGVIFIEQPIKRAAALARDIAPLAAERPVIIDESDDALDAFPRARALGYTGVSSKTCKGLYKSMINAARCAHWNRQAGTERYFMSAEDLTIQAGLAIQQDLALVSLLGIRHVERNGHHYVNGMAGLPASEQQAFLQAHPDLYEQSHGATRVAIRDGALSIGSLARGPGYAAGALPDWDTLRAMGPAP